MQNIASSTKSLLEWIVLVSMLFAIVGIVVAPKAHGDLGPTVAPSHGYLLLIVAAAMFLNAALSFAEKRNISGDASCALAVYSLFWLFCN